MDLIWEKERLEKGINQKYAAAYKVIRAATREPGKCHGSLDSILSKRKVKSRDSSALQWTIRQFAVHSSSHSEMHQINSTAHTHTFPFVTIEMAASNNINSEKVRLGKI